MTELKTNKMGTMPVGKLLFQMALPMVLSMLVQALYNIVDSVFVGMYDQNALNGISNAFPAQNMMIGVATGVGVGVNALLSRSLGERDQARANRSAGNGLFLILLSYLLFLVFGLVGSELFLSFQTDNADVIREGSAYLRIVTTLSFGLFGQVIVERFLQATGKTIFSMVTQMVGALTNIILDPIMIFGLLGCPELGVAGAAYATVIGQAVAAIVGFVLHFRHNREIGITPRDLRPERKVISRILAVAIPSILMVAIGSFMMTGLNIILKQFGTGPAEEGKLGQTVFGVYFKLQSFVFMPIFGLNNALVPILAFNYGAGNRRRMMATLRLAAISAVSLMLLGLALMQIIPGPMLRLFSLDGSAMEIGIPALRTISLSFIFAGFCIVIGSSFQALGCGIYSMLVSFARQIVVLLPAAALLALTGRITAVWFAFPLAEIMSVAVSLLLFLRLYRKTISRVPLGDPVK